ncbi:Hypothetical predicted protein [Xyrichtys novacula]|uniref:Uncharacterized protein n=1 Tax=Xyrichtys novacula TaxID=13765 RepID=A0AAV1EI76_XYRNO|nr:Hypothetical predicted protein [Xyrichtys novacula]
MTRTQRSPSRGLERLVVVAADKRVSEGWAQGSPVGAVRAPPGTDGEESPLLARGSTRGPLHVGGEVVFTPTSNGDQEVAGPEGAGPGLVVVGGAAAGRSEASGEPWSGVWAASRLEEEATSRPECQLR